MPPSSSATIKNVSPAAPAPVLTRLSVAVMLALAGTVLPVIAQQQPTTPSQTELDAAIQEGLKANKLLPTPGSLFQRPAKTGPRLIYADEVDAENQKTVSARGRVLVKQGDLEVTADQVDYNQLTDLATVPGRVKLDRGGDIVTGMGLQLTVATEIGTLEKPTFFFSKSPTRPAQRYEARGTASRMKFEGPEQERLFDATYTTCRPDQNDWYLKVSELALDRTTNVGTGINGYVEFKGVPILYMPYMTFPLNNERKSGFLPPSFGSSTSSGLELAIPYYVNLSPNRDATITPKIFTRRGMQLGAEFRYLGSNYLGQFDTEYLPNDRVAERDRYLFSLRHYQNLGNWLAPGWSASINAQTVSDDNYFRDLSTRIASTAQTNLPREAALNYTSFVGDLTMRYLDFQTLQDPILPVPIPYKLAPQITFNAHPNRWKGVEFNALGEFTDFHHPTLVNGQRLIFYPSAALPLEAPYGFITPKIGFHSTRYQLTANEGDRESGSRNVPIVSVDSGLSFERSMKLWDSAITQTLEPRLFFLYVPYRDQSKLPNFSTAITDFSFAQIFNENLFVGGDRISDARQVTAAVTTRFIEDLTGIERLRAAIGQRYYFSPQRVNLDNLVTPSADQQGNLSRSDLLVGLSGQLSSSWFLDSGFQYSTSKREFQRNNIAARYNADNGRILNFSYRFTRDSIKQVDISAQWPFGKIAPAWTLLARANHSFQDKRLIEGLLGVEYNQGCWEFRLVAHRFVTATQQYSNSIQFQLELKGLSKLGINPLETLRQNIPGYQRSDDRL
ncbi:MAG: LPS-assembly protein LptD [Betaproteobacteria bacterium]